MCIDLEKNCLRFGSEEVRFLSPQVPVIFLCCHEPANVVTVFHSGIAFLGDT